MPTTRSQRASEPLQRLETPPKRTRKQKPSQALKLKSSRTLRNLGRPPSLSPERSLQKRFLEYLRSTHGVDETTHPFSHMNASTQVEEVAILTLKIASAMPDKSSTSFASSKRDRDVFEDSEEEPTAKRHQTFTPQNNKNSLWMFGNFDDNNYPRTAPVKSLAAASATRRRVRGPLSKQSLAHTPRRTHLAAGANGRNSTKAFEPSRTIKPIEHDSPQSPHSPGRSRQLGLPPVQEPQTPQQNGTHQGIFGSIRRFVTNLTPFSSRIEHVEEEQPLPSTPKTQDTHVDRSEDRTEERRANISSTEQSATTQDDSGNVAKPQQPRSEPRRQRVTRFDHLHYIPAGGAEDAPTTNGDVEVPPAQNPPSPAAEFKAAHPELDDSLADAIITKRKRQQAAQAHKDGKLSETPNPDVAPLFGPDSHFARGTVDPRHSQSRPWSSLSKRTFNTFSEDAPDAKSNGFGLDYSDTDMDSSEGNSNEYDENHVETPLAKKQKMTASFTPRSALKKPGDFGASVGRKSVNFGVNPVSGSRGLRAHYGPAGQYKGSTFADESPPRRSDGSTMSSLGFSDFRPLSAQNGVASNVSARENLGAHVPDIDFTLRDPNDSSWRPSLSNPRPGHFRVPDLDEEMEDESMIEEEATPAQPQTPRMSHAELPGAANSSSNSTTGQSISGADSTTSGVNGNGVAEHALDKARSMAQKYKPKESSRLSNVSKVLSRSPSPDAEDREDSTESDVRSTRTPLDNTTRGADGMTAYEREHQYDDWAAKLTWDAPQTYEEAGTGSKFIHDLIRKNWTDDDDKRSALFWQREFNDVGAAMIAAKQKGLRLELVTGMEEDVRMIAA